MSPAERRLERAQVMLRVQRSVDLANRRYPEAPPAEDPRGESSASETRPIDAFLRSIIRAEDAERAETLNAELRNTAARPELVREGGMWRLAARANTGDAGDQLLVDAATAILDLMRLGGIDRLGTCAAPACDRLRIDRSRNRSRVYCSVACANRVATTAYRARSMASA